MRAALSQMGSQYGRNIEAEENAAARRPTEPMAIPAEPGNANEVADSIEARM